ncbi:sensor domain-containing diguanylate cyclase [Marinomonas epiphytica]
MEEVTITDQFTKATNFQLAYFIDNSHHATFSDIKNKVFNVASNAVSLGKDAKTTWIKIHLSNTLSENKRIFLSLPYAYRNSLIEFYHVTQNKTVSSKIIDLNSPPPHQWMYRGNAIFNLELAAGQDSTIYIRQKTFSYQWFKVELFSEDASSRSLSSTYIDTSLIVGMLFALTIYNLMLFISSRLYEHFFYACYLISCGIWIALSFGLFANFFDLYGRDAFHWYLSLGAIPLFLLAFMMSVFETRKHYPIEHKILLTTIIIMFAELIYGLFNLEAAFELAADLASFLMSVGVGISISMLIRKHPLAPYFLISHGLFILFASYSILFYRGKVEFTYLSSHGVCFGILLEAIGLAMIIAYRMKLLEKLSASQSRLKSLAVTDPLTQLFNRRGFYSTIEPLLEQEKYRQKVNCVAQLDIDFFKKVNDQFGHGVGDQVIARVANELKKQCRLEDISGRFGGEEFVLFIPNTRLQDAFHFVERIRTSLAAVELVTKNNEAVRFTVSIGVAQIDNQTHDIEEALSKADLALYHSKQNGRNQTSLFGLDLSPPES